MNQVQVFWRSASTPEITCIACAATVLLVSGETVACACATKYTLRSQMSRGYVVRMNVRVSDDG